MITEFWNIQLAVVAEEGVPTIFPSAVPDPQPRRAFADTRIGRPRATT